MRYPVDTRIVLSTIVVGILAGVLSYVEAATVGFAGDGHLWNMVFGLGTVVVVDAVFSYWFGDKWWFLPTAAVDQ